MTPSSDMNTATNMATNTTAGMAPSTAAIAHARASPMSASDYLFLGAVVTALFIVADPLNTDLERLPATRHLPLMLSLTALLLASVGSLLRPPGVRRAAAGWPVTRVAFPMALLAGWILGGSIYARIADGIQDTFLNTGMYMMLTFVMARGLLLSDARERLCALCVRAIAASAAYMIVRMLVEHVWTGGKYHELEYMVAPVAVYFALTPSISPAWRRLLVLFFLIGAISFLKNTAFIVILITCVYLWWVDWRFRLQQPRPLYRVMMMGAAAAAVALTAFFYFGNALTEDVSLPSGNPGYRVRAYDKAITRFYESPAWGTLFATRSTAHFTAFEVDVPDAGNQLPTHSDPLDLAANGGLIALGLLSWSYARIARLCARSVLGGNRPGKVRSEANAAAHMFACMSISGIVVYAFNPIMLQPDKAMLLWTNLGLLLGICLHRAADGQTNAGIDEAGAAVSAGGPDKPTDNVTAAADMAMGRTTGTTTRATMSTKANAGVSAR
jgi:hypothetical protein